MCACKVTIVIIVMCNSSIAMQAVEVPSVIYFKTVFACTIPSEMTVDLGLAERVAKHSVYLKEGIWGAAPPGV